MALFFWCPAFVLITINMSLLLRENVVIRTKSGSETQGKFCFLVSSVGPDYYGPTTVVRRNIVFGIKSGSKTQGIFLFCLCPAFVLITMGLLLIVRENIVFGTSRVVKKHWGNYVFFFVSFVDPDCYYGRSYIL